MKIRMTEDQKLEFKFFNIKMTCFFFGFLTKVILKTEGTLCLNSVTLIVPPSFSQRRPPLFKDNQWRESRNYPSGKKPKSMPFRET